MNASQLIKSCSLRALEFYDPVAKKHGQAHMQARCVLSWLRNCLFRLINIIRLGITQFLINGGLASLEEIRDANGKLENLYVRVSQFLLVVCAVNHGFLG